MKTEILVHGISLKKIAIALSSLAVAAFSGCSSMGSVKSQAQATVIHAADFKKLPSHMSLADLSSRWGTVEIDGHFVATYNTGTYDFVYEAMCDINSGPRDGIDPKLGLEVWGLALTDQRTGRSDLIWFSEKYLSSRVVLEKEIDALPVNLKWAQVKAHFGDIRPRWITPTIAVAAYKSELDGYWFDVFIDTQTTRDDAQLNSAKVTSLYLRRGNYAALKWGSYINLKTGALFKPSKPFGERLPNGFLGINQDMD